MNYLDLLNEEQVVSILRSAIAIASGPRTTPLELSELVELFCTDFPLPDDRKKQLLASPVSIDQATEELKRLPLCTRQTMAGWFVGMSVTLRGRPDRDPPFETPIFDWPETQELERLINAISTPEERDILHEYDLIMEQMRWSGPLDGRQRRLALVMEQMPYVGVSYQALARLGEPFLSVPTSYGNVDPLGHATRHFRGLGAACAWIAAMYIRLLGAALDRKVTKDITTITCSYDFNFKGTLTRVGLNFDFYKKKKNAQAKAEADEFTAHGEILVEEHRKKMKAIGHGEYHPSATKRPGWLTPLKRLIKEGAYEPV
jgi:hypothetical protein